jgi:hypothetical protein
LAGPAASALHKTGLVQAVSLSQILGLNACIGTKIQPAFVALPFYMWLSLS